MSEDEAKPICDILLRGMDCLSIEVGLVKFDVETAKKFAEKHTELDPCRRLLEWLNSEFVRKRTYE